MHVYGRPDDSDASVNTGIIATLEALSRTGITIRGGYILHHQIKL